MANLNLKPSFTELAANRRIRELLEGKGVCNFTNPRLVQRFELEREKLKHRKDSNKLKYKGFSKYEANSKFESQNLNPYQYVIKIYFDPTETEKVQALNLKEFMGVPLILKPWEVRDGSAQ